MKEKEEERLQKMLEIEEGLYSKGIKLVCGVDEAGRGPLCGPVVAAAVILKPDSKIEGVNDSKKLSEKKREQVYENIMENALAVGVGMSDVDVIESVNILNATKLAMKEAISKLKVQPDPGETVVHGDAISESIAAASIVAKVTRDRMLIEWDKTYPEYGFAKHKGYGTKAHTDAIAKYGLTPLHRPSFCTKFVKGGK